MSSFYATQRQMFTADELRHLGESQRRRCDGDGGVAAYEEAIALLRGSGDPLRLAHAIRHLGDIHEEQRRPDLAAPCYDEALAIYRAHPDAPALDVANAIRSQAVLKEQTGQLDQAADLWNEARELYAKANVDVAVAETSRRLSRLGRT